MSYRTTPHSEYYLSWAIQLTDKPFHSIHSHEIFHQCIIPSLNYWKTILPYVVMELLWLLNFCSYSVHTLGSKGRIHLTAGGGRCWDYDFQWLSASKIICNINIINVPPAKIGHIIYGVSSCSNTSLFLKLCNGYNSHNHERHIKASP